MNEDRDLYLQIIRQMLYIIFFLLLIQQCETHKSTKSPKLQSKKPTIAPITTETAVEELVTEIAQGPEAVLGRSLSVPGSKDCSCSSYSSCMCCNKLLAEKLMLGNKLLCIQIDFELHKLQLSIVGTLSATVLFKKKIGVSSLPPYCFSLPHTELFADLCVKIQDVKLEFGNIKICVSAQPRITKQVVTTIPLGCYEFGTKSQLFKTVTNMIPPEFSKYIPKTGEAGEDEDGIVEPVPAEPPAGTAK